MHNNSRSAWNTLVVVVGVGVAILTGASASFADVFGTLQFAVKNADDEKPIAAAKITLHDTAGVHPDTSIVTDQNGMAKSQPLEIRAWDVTTESDLFQPDTRQVQVVADTVTPVEILLEPLNEKVFKIVGQRQLVSQTQTTTENNLDQKFLQTFPTNVGNPLSLQNVEAANPGFVADSVNQVHPRGEHCSTTISIDGVALPGANQGRIGQVIASSVVQNVDILTGAYAPEYGGETAAILNVNLRAGSIVPFEDFKFGIGGYSTYYGDLSLSGQAGPAMDSSSDTTNGAKRLAYFIDLTGRTTDNAVEAPQPDNQTAHNSGQNENLFGNVSYALGKSDNISLTLNDDPAYSEIANRTGLPAYYASVGQGFGYAGHLSAVDAAAEGIVSQQAAGQNINQRDANTFSVLDWKHTINADTNSMLSFGYISSDLSLTNGNPLVNLSNLPHDSSIEFNPTLMRDSQHAQVQGSIANVQGSHHFKVGGLYDDQTGDEQYQFIPASQLALDALATLDQRLVAPGKFTGATDELGNKVYNLTGPNPVAPTLNVHRSGYYAAAYLQDTWNVSSKFTADYGLRFDAYNQTENLGSSAVNQDILSPRVNLAYKLAPGTIVRTSYDKLFTEPPLAQGSILGQPILPQITDQYEIDLEHQVTQYQVAKISAYTKKDENQIDVGLLIPGTQIGAYTAVNFQEGHVHGVELSYDFLPHGDQGWSGYAGWTISTAKPTGLDNTGAPVPIYNDHDQLNTVTAGAAYSWKSGLSAATDFYYGSGVASSEVFDNGPRTPRSYVNLDLKAEPRMFGPKNHIGLELAVENVFNNTPVINFDSGFSGTRFQQARTLMLYSFMHF
jgi:outer membrane receptor protein involved in Fe transport